MNSNSWYRGSFPQSLALIHVKITEETPFLTDERRRTDDGHPRHDISYPDSQVEFKRSLTAHAFEEQDLHE